MEENLKALAMQLRDAVPILRRHEIQAAKEGLLFSQGDASGRAEAYEGLAQKIEWILSGAPIY